jgi:hypothetical protein
MLDRLLKISSISGAVLIFCGVLKLIIYYSAFGVKIVEFLTFSEIITSFLDDINLLLIFALAMVIQSLPLLNYLRRKSKLSLEEFYNAVLAFVYSKKYKFIAFFVGVGSVIGLLLFIDILFFNYLIIYILIFCVIQSLTYLVMSPDDEGTIVISDASVSISIIITVGIAIFLLAQHDIQETKAGGVSATVHISNGVIECGKKMGNIYVGKTDSYVFVRQNERSTICIPVSEIKQIDFRKR